MPPHRPGKKKACTRCGRVLPRTPKYFYAHQAAVDGLEAKCKQCSIRRTGLWHQANPESSLIANRKYEASHRKLRRLKNRRYRQSHRRGIAIKHRKWGRLNPDAIQARNAIIEAIRRGRLCRPRRCSRCGALHPKISGHHDNYEKKYWLTVRWLCPSCHKSFHAQWRRVRRCR